MGLSEPRRPAGSQRRVMVIGGYSPSLLNFRGPLLRALVQAGHEVVACGPEDDERVRDGLAAIGVRFRVYPLRRTSTGPLSDLKAWWAIGRLYREEQPDWVLAYTAKPVIYANLARLRQSKPQVFSLVTGLGYGFGAESGRQRLVGRVVRALYRVALRFGAGVIFQNPDDRAVFQQQKLLPAGMPAEVVNGSGVDLDFFPPCDLPSRPVFLMVARLLIEKGVRDYCAAAREIKRQFPDARFELAGPLDSNPACVSQEELTGWMDEGLIDYLGVLDDVRPALARCRVFVLPSYYREGTPRTILEALAMGRPVITTDSPGCRQTVVDGDNGFLVPPRDARALAQAMRRMIEASSAETERMAAASLALAREKFDVHKVNQRMLQIMGL